MKPRPRFLAVRMVLAGLVTAACSAGRADAGFVTYTESFTASGTLGGQAFTNAAITISLDTDTTLVTSSDGLFQTPIMTTTIDVGSLGTTVFSDKVFAFDNQNLTSAGFYDNTLGSNIVYDVAPFFGTYDLQTAIPPTMGTTKLVTGVDFGTSLGKLNFSSSMGMTAFSAAFPEPGSLGMVGVGVAGAWVLARRRMFHPLAPGGRGRR
jgi:PEP-CTERM motif